ncbi:MAG: hypothetical protein NWE88_04085 [Candidatus Bathyarchaeota archaeon]|nr:hypothetical protein [Candidatus Bathyarchaeota archaeon]
MGRLNVRIENELEEKFRLKVFERKGMKKGNITSAIEEAMVLWINATPPSNDEIMLKNDENKNERPVE